MEADREYKEIALTEIAPSGTNPRTKFVLDDLIASIKKKGIIVPLVVRPMPCARQSTDAIGKNYEIVAGERRYRAALAVSKENGGPRQYLVPAIVRHNLTDDDVFEIQTIENLQREDLTELEEAWAYRQWTDKKGEESVPDLAERLGISPRYIRRRLSVLVLPLEVLDAWEEGKLHYGHLEQLCRVENEKDRMELFKSVGLGKWSVVNLKRNIDTLSMVLKAAVFDKKAAGCVECRFNSTVQRKLFGDDYAEEKGRCDNPACFKKRTNDWLLANWAAFAKKHELATTGFRFRDRGAYSGNGYENFSGTGAYGPRKACLACGNFVTLIETNGAINSEMVCLDSKCFKITTRKNAKKQKESGEPSGPAGPRIEWHGAFFRERFWQTAIPLHYDRQPRLMHLKLQILVLLAADKHGADLRFGQTYDPAGVQEHEWGSTHYPLDRVWTFLGSVSEDRLEGMLKAITLGMILDGGYLTAGTLDGAMRHRLAVDLGVSLQDEWRMDKEYLDKKTVAEIHALAQEFGLWKDPKCEAFLYETLGKKRGKFESCKKGELVRIILESGVDLAGKVPAEILKADRGADADPMEEKERTCRVCGCTEESACEGGCSWVEKDLCSACVNDKQDG